MKPASLIALTTLGVRVPTLIDGIVLLDGYEQADVAAIVAGEDEEHARRCGWWPARSTERDGERAIKRWQRQWA